MAKRPGKGGGVYGEGSRMWKRQVEAGKLGQGMGRVKSEVTGKA